jgi:hypothetical protein
MSDGEHALFSPSSMHRWAHCAGALAMEDGLPNEDSEYSAEGNAAHQLGYRALRYGKPCEFYRGEEIQIGERVFTVDDEMIINVQTYVDDTLMRMGAGCTLLVEQRLDMSEVYRQPKQFGTGDAVIIDLPKRHLTVKDLKYGQGVKVFAEMNEQGMSYASGAMATYMLDGLIDNVTIVIDQPRLYHLDEWTISVESLAGFAYGAAHAAAAAKEILDAVRAGTMDQEQLETQLTPAEKTCQWCKVKARCNKLSRHISNEVLLAFEAINDGSAPAMSAPTVPDDNELLGRKASSLGLIYDWCAAVDAELRRRVTSGISILGSDGLPFKTVQGKAGNREWIDEKIAETALTEVLGDNAFKPREILTPAAADTKINGRKKTKAAAWAPLVQLYRQKPGSISVVPGSDPRPAYSGEASIDEFKVEEDLTA